MGIIQDQWSSKKSRVEDGIFFGSDEYIALHGMPGTGYSLAERRSVSDLVASEPEAWSHLYATVTTRLESRDMSVHAGETSWEGEGFVAIVSHSSGQLLWLFHLSASEPFAEVRIDGDIIRAKSGGYPDCYDWSIPISAPEAFTVSRSL